MKKNNKGFSLVELIVVILIMAILGVALTPQVMKWVNNSRISSDMTNYTALFDAATLALTDETTYTAYSKSVLTITMDSDGTSITAINPADPTKTNFETELSRVSPGWDAVKAKVSNTYTIFVANGIVLKGVAPKDDGTTETITSAVPTPIPVTP